MGRFRASFVAILVICTGLSAAASDWTRFRGPNGTGISADKDIPVVQASVKSAQVGGGVQTH